MIAAVTAGWRITYDERMTIAAERLGLRCGAPG